MRLTRSQSMIVAVGTLLLFFVAVYAIIEQDPRQVPKLTDSERARIALQSGDADDSTAQNGAEKAPGEPAGTADTTEGHSLFVLHNFERSEIKDGRKTWEVKARQGEYFPATSSAKVSQAVMWTYQEGGDVVRLEADEAQLKLQGTALVKVEAQGNVKLTKNDELVVTTDSATYDRTANLVYAPGEVAISGKAINVNGKAMTVDLVSEEVRLENDVRTVIDQGQN